MLRALAAFAIALALAAIAPCDGAIAVVISAGDGTGNTSAPSNDPGFAHVAALGDLTGVYLGGGWILTADHVPPDRDAVIEGVVYPAVVGSRIVLETTPGVPADLALYKIQGDPGLPWLALSTTPPMPGETVVMAGQGWNRGATLSYWNSSWQPVAPAMAAFTGFVRGSDRALRWGHNTVIAASVPVVLGGKTTTSFRTLFDDSAFAFSDEAQAVQGDSGGAVFLERSGSWELAGVMFTVATYTNQPADTAVYGTETYSVEIAGYAEEIDEITRPSVPIGPPLAIAALAVALVAGARHAVSRRRA